MKLRILSIVLISVTTLTVFGQQPIIKWAKDNHLENERYSIHSIKPSIDNQVISLQLQAKGSNVIPVITTYDDKSFEKLKAISVFVDKKGFSFNDFISIKNNSLFFTSYYDAKEKTTEFYCQRYDSKTLTTIANPISLGKFSSIRKSRQSSSSFILSQDSTKLLMMGQSPHVPKDSEKYYLSVYTPEITKLWDRQVELPYSDKAVKIISTSVTNDGQVGVVIKHYDKNTTAETIKINGKILPSYRLKLLLYSAGQNEPNEYLFDTNKFINSLEIVDEDKDHIELFGLFGDTDNRLTTHFFISKIDKRSKTISNNIYEFPSQLLERVKKDEQGEYGKQSGLSEYFSFSKLAKRSNNIRDYIIEYYKPGNGYGHYGNIIDIKIQANGNIAINRIPRLASANLMSLNGVVDLTSGDDLKLLYIDTKRNVENDINNKIKTNNLMGGLPMLLSYVVIDKDDKINRTLIEQLHVVPRMSSRLSDKSAIIYKINFYGNDVKGILTLGK